MNRKMYRLCLAMVIMAAVVSGILYYRILKKKTVIPQDGVFVWEELTGSGCV